MHQIFPYSVRPVQETMLNFLDKNLKREQHLVIEAANGAGKTIVALSAAISYKNSLGLAGEDMKIVVLSRTNSQADRVIDELLKMKGDYPALSKRGKESMCNNPEVNEPSKIPFQTRCERAVKLKKCSYYSKFKKPTKSLGLEDIQNSLLTFPMYAQDVIAEADNIEICAAELANSLMPHLDIISGSYLYLFDPEIEHSFVKLLGVDLSKIILIIDECHNLPNIVFEACEYTISSYQISRAKKELKGYDLRFVEIFESLMNNQAVNKLVPPLDFLDNYEDKLEGVHVDHHENNDHVFHVVKHLSDAIKTHKIKTKSTFAYTEQIVRFLSNLYNDGDKTYRTLIKEQVGTQTVLKFSLLDPSKNIASVLRQVHCSISMSGSLAMNSYLSLTGIRFLNHSQLILPSPYDPSNVKVLVTKGLTTKFNQRISTTFQKMALMVSSMMKKGKNTGMFMPSYGVLREIRKFNLGTTKIFEAKSEMNADDTDKLVDEFKKEKGALLISVMGGRSSEGTDFKGDSMEMVAIAGVPFGMPDTLTDARIKYFDKISQNGWNLIYLARALQQLSQAAGRPLRSLEDRVFILILDDRVMKYEKQFPFWMQCFELIEPDPNELQKHLKSFYG